MNGESVITDWAKDIQKVARRASNDWPGVIEEEDLVQEIYLHILEAPGTERDLAGMGDNARYQTLNKIAQRITSRERDNVDRFSGNFRYSVDEVRALLGSVGDLSVPGVGSSWKVGDGTKSGGGHADPTATAATWEPAMGEARRA